MALAYVNVFVENVLRNSFTFQRRSGNDWSLKIIGKPNLYDQNVLLYTYYIDVKNCCVLRIVSYFSQSKIHLFLTVPVILKIQPEDWN